MTADKGDSGEALWRWSLRTYDMPGVAERLVRLQDGMGLNVNVLLWCCWCAQSVVAIPDLVVKKAIDLTAMWSRDVTGALRSARGALKTPPRQVDAAAAAALRARIKAVELEAEKIEQSMLGALAADMLTPALSPDGSYLRARRTLSQYAGLAGVVRKDGFSTLLLDDLALCVFPSADARRREEA